MKVLMYLGLLAFPYSLAVLIEDGGTEYPLQTIPSTAKAPNTFHRRRTTDANLERGQPGQVAIKLPPQYQAKEIDLPFGRILYGNVKYFQQGEMNTPNSFTDADGGVGVADDANQTACGIPDNAYRDSKIAIHPYWLKYAGLDRMCLQDVCVGFFTKTDDMIAKVTDICSTDPSDESYCATPEDIKLPKAKVKTIYHYGNGEIKDIPQLQGSGHPDKLWWTFAKCLGEAIVQPPYKGPGTSNWFSTPPYPANNDNAVHAALDQAGNNQKSYPAKGWPTYTQGVTPGKDKLEGLHKPVTDWKEGDAVPSWQPLAGGRGSGNAGSGGTGTGNGTTGNGTTDYVGSDRVGSDPGGSDPVGSGAGTNSGSTNETGDTGAGTSSGGDAGAAKPAGGSDSGASGAGNGTLSGPNGGGGKGGQQVVANQPQTQTKSKPGCTGKKRRRRGLKRE